MTPAKLRADAARELLASMEAERQAYAAPKCCTDAAQGGGLCLGHMLSASSPHCGCRAALALAELMPVMEAWVEATGLIEDEDGDELELGCQSHPARPVAYCTDCKLLAAWTKAKESLL